MSNKKANGAAVALIVIIIVVILYAIIANAVKECRSDDQYGADRYCGSDFKCHEMKVINNHITQNEYHLWKTSFILGIAIIAAAIILRWKKP